MWLVPLALETLLTTSMSRDLLLSSTPLHTQPPPTPNLWETERQGADCTSPPAERSPGALGGANSLFNSSIRSDFGVLEVAKSARRARCLRKKPGKRVQRELRKFQAGPQPAGKGFPEGRGAERRGDLESTHHPKPGCKGRELRVVGSEKEKKKKKAGGGGSNRKVEEREGKKQALGSRVLRGTQRTTPGQGVGNKAAASGQQGGPVHHFHSGAHDVRTLTIWNIATHHADGKRGTSEADPAGVSSVRPRTHCSRPGRCPLASPRRGRKDDCCKHLTPALPASKGSPALGEHHWSVVYQSQCGQSLTS
ncbi:uncharacterized protein [Desmodus rotundus]|uniref:uncharacterized protein n=1 Tax=Desmodus rotundus TaxID=9430 RepID=UPI0023810AB8|nr:uncharacterized protein LOC128780937 [Desmodus rotundus]